MLRVAVLIPCYNEQATIAKVIADFKKALSGAAIYVYDNRSIDATATLAVAAGAIVRRETRAGKGNVVRRMFADVDADIYVLVDGDDTYDATAAPAMVDMLVNEGLDMIAGVRIAQDKGAYRSGHRFGNRLLTGFASTVFGRTVSDMLTGYRVFSRRFVKSFPALSTGFETETELTIHALELRMPIGEMATVYKERPEGSASKLRTYADGFRILQTIILLIKEERPLHFFGITGVILCVTGLALGAPVVAEYLQTHLVPRLPTAVLATGLIILSFISLACGLMLDSVMRGRKEAKRLAYLTFGGVGSRGSS